MHHLLCVGTGCEDERRARDAGAQRTGRAGDATPALSGPQGATQVPPQPSLSPTFSPAQEQVIGTVATRLES